MARWKATDACVPNLTLNYFLHVDHPKVGRGVTSPGDVGSAYTPQKTVLRH